MATIHIKRRWYYIALFLPVIVPALFFVFFSLLGEPDTSVFLMFSLPQLYVPFTIAVILWGYNKPSEKLLAASWFLPLLFSVFCFTTIVLLGDSKGAVAVGLIALAVGYIYVLLAQGLLWLVCKHAEHKAIQIRDE